MQIKPIYYLTVYSPTTTAVRVLWRAWDQKHNIHMFECSGWEEMLLQSQLRNLDVDDNALIQVALHAEPENDYDLVAISGKYLFSEIKRYMQDGVWLDVLKRYKGDYK